MMACIDEQGQLTSSAIKLLESIQSESLSVEFISEKTAIPLFKVRSSLRDMKSMGFVIEEDEKYQKNPKVEKLLLRP